MDIDDMPLPDIDADDPVLKYLPVDGVGRPTSTANPPTVYPANFSLKRPIEKTDKRRNAGERARMHWLKGATQDGEKGHGGIPDHLGDISSRLQVSRPQVGRPQVGRLQVGRPQVGRPSKSTDDPKVNLAKPVDKLEVRSARDRELKTSEEAVDSKETLPRYRQGGEHRPENQRPKESLDVFAEGKKTKRRKTKRRKTKRRKTKRRKTKRRKTKRRKTK